MKRCQNKTGVLRAILEPVRFASDGGSLERALSILWRNGYAAITVLPDVRAGVAAVAAAAKPGITASRR